MSMPRLSTVPVLLAVLLLSACAAGGHNGPKNTITVDSQPQGAQVHAGDPPAQVASVHRGFGHHCQVRAVKCTEAQVANARGQPRAIVGGALDDGRQPPEGLRVQGFHAFEL